MNTGRLLYIICLLTISVVGGNLKAQTIVKHQIGFDIRPGYVAPTNSFLEGDNARQKTIDQSLSDTNNGAIKDKIALIFSINFPSSISTPRDACAFIIRCVSSINVGIKRNAIEIIIAISCAGT